MNKITRNHIYAAGLSLTTGLIVFLLNRYGPPRILYHIVNYIMVTLSITGVLFGVGYLYWFLLDYLAQRRQAKIAAVLKRLTKKGEMKDYQ